MQRSIRSLLHGCVALALAATLAPAQAIDAVTAPLPAPVPDAQLTVTDRSLLLPEGTWTLVGRAEGFMKTGVDRKSPHFTLYAMNVERGRMRAGVVLRMPVASTPVKHWIDEPCKVDGYVFRDDFGEVGHTANCLLVFKRRSHLAANPGEGVYAQAREWAAGQAVIPRGPFYEISYSRFGTNEFGWVRVFVPIETFGSDDDAVAWARELPGALQRLFEKRDRQAALPPLPRKKS